MTERVLPSTDIAKGLRALGTCLKEPRRGLAALSRSLATLYQEEVARTNPIPAVGLGDRIGRSTEVTLCDFEPRNGNVAPLELMALAGLVRLRAPRLLLEIGTFDGNSTLQMAANSPEEALLFTLDLPPGAVAEGALEARDTPYIADMARHSPRFQSSPAGRKVRQLHGDSASFDFHALLEHGPVEFAFIDGSHSYDYVRSDTLKVFEILAPCSMVVWHDYCPGWPGVMRWLDELSTKLPLERIAGTTLVVLENR